MRQPLPGEGVGSAETQVGPDDMPSSQRESRRAFIRQSAEVAVLSLFGITALDPIVNAVLARMDEVTWMRTVARRAGDTLEEAGIGQMAFAGGCSNCNPAAAFDCAPTPPDRRFRCNPFTCRTADRFQCNAWSFLCNTVSVPPSPAFECVVDGQTVNNFNCTTAGEEPNFKCEAGYKCPGVNQFIPWDCPHPITSHCQTPYVNNTCTSPGATPPTTAIRAPTSARVPLSSIAAGIPVPTTTSAQRARSSALGTRCTTSDVSMTSSAPTRSSAAKGSTSSVAGSWEKGVSATSTALRARHSSVEPEDRGAASRACRATPSTPRTMYQAISAAWEAREHSGLGAVTTSPARARTTSSAREGTWVILSVCVPFIARREHQPASSAVGTTGNALSTAVRHRSSARERTQTDSFGATCPSLAGETVETGRGGTRSGGSSARR